MVIVLIKTNKANFVLTFLATALYVWSMKKDNLQKVSIKDPMPQKKPAKNPAWSKRLESSYKGIRSGWVSTDRARLLEWASRAPSYQRDISPTRVAGYEKLMREGKWFPEAGGPFKFCAEEGAMIQGNHRTLAMLKANIYPKVFVQFGIPNGKFIYCLEDDVKSKKLNDLLKAHGAPCYRNLGPAVRQVLSYDRGAQPGKNWACMINDAFEFYLSEEEIFNYWVSLNNELNILIGPTFRCGISVLLELYGGYEREEIEQFWIEIRDCIGHQATQTVRKVLTTNANKVRTSLTTIDKYRLCLFGFEARHRDEPLKTFNKPFKRFS